MTIKLLLLPVYIRLRYAPVVVFLVGYFAGILLAVLHGWWDLLPFALCLWVGAFTSDIKRAIDEFEPELEVTFK
ncbi:MAG: hypothetical protein Q8Q08_12910 [Candidatus Omnitrophota bacterium]|nr:hypothetical protein [Candidatus Omnitrophota bacterium]